MSNNESSDGVALGISTTANANVSDCIFFNNIDHNGEITGSIKLARETSSLDIQYSDVEGGQDGIINNNDGTLNWGEGNIDADPLFCEPDSGNYTLMANSPCVGTGENGANMGAFGVGCEEINLAPVLATIEDQQIAEDSILTIGVSATSDINASMSFTATSDTSDVSVTMDSTTLTATPAPDWNGSSLITVIVIDENGLSDTTDFTLTVNAVNDAPVANNDTIICGPNYIMNAIPSVGIGTWTANSPNIQIFDTNNPNTNITATTLDIYANVVIHSTFSANTMLSRIQVRTM